MPPDVSVVAPVYRSRETLGELHERIARVLDARQLSWELILVDDRCPEGSGAEADRLARDDARIKALHLPENGGQQRAVIAGIRESTGQAVVAIDADLQDPPEAIPALLDRLGEASVIFSRAQGTYQSRDRMRSSRAFKPLMASLARMPADYGAFIALDRHAADALCRFKTAYPYVPGMAGLLNLPVEGVPVDRSVRTKGSSSYSGRARLRIAMTALACVVWWRLTGAGPAALKDTAAA